MIFKWPLRLFFSLFIVGHLSLISLHLMPVNPLSLRVKKITDFYVGRLFSQNWHLFAPEPGNSTTKLFYRCNDGEKWSDILDPFKEINKAHFRFTPDGLSKVLYILHNLGRDLYWKNVEIVQNEDSDLKETKEYQNVSKVVKALCLRDNPKSFLGEAIVSQVYAKKFSERHEEKYFDKVEQLLNVLIGF